MKILINYNENIKGSYNINLNEAIIELLNNVPLNMKNLNYQDRYKLIINDITKCFGHVLDKNKFYNNIEFAETIKNIYDLNNLKIKYMYEFLMAM